MLFNSAVFIGLFLPITLIGYFIAGRSERPRYAILWLVGASIVFYAYWKVAYVPLLLASVLGNYAMGLALARNPQRWLLVAGIAGNIALLAWFKYANFLVDNVNVVAGTGMTVPQIVLPLAISFYTFQQIGYLVDTYDGKGAERDLPRYSLFVLFFPQLIAGPIVHHREILGQLNSPETYRPNSVNLTLGATVFAVGLFKKVGFADSLSPIANGMFSEAAAGAVPAFADAWIGTLAYALQLYFDFSGYSEMAIGLGLMFNIRLPINFWSPYKAVSIIDFWNRWHMTLTRFLTNYVYNPILMHFTRKRVARGRPLLRRSSFALEPFLALLVMPTLATMFLSGIWHGAGWQFVIWGVLHGLMLVINHAWRAFRQAFGIGPEVGAYFRPLGVLVTFLGVSVALVFFKSSTVAQALLVLRGLFDVFSITGPETAAVMTPEVGGLVLACLALVWTFPNPLQWVGSFEPRGVEARPESRSSWAPAKWHWSPSFANGALVGTVICFALIWTFGETPSEFLYFTF